MSAHHEIYVDSGLDLDESAAQVAHVLRRPLLPPHQDYRVVVGEGAGISYLLWPNEDAVDDPEVGLYLSRYPLMILVRANDPSARASEREAADALFDLLRGLGGRLILVFDGQTLLREA